MFLGSLVKWLVQFIWFFFFRKRIYLLPLGLFQAPQSGQHTGRYAKWSHFSISIAKALHVISVSLCPSIAPMNWSYVKAAIANACTFCHGRWAEGWMNRLKMQRRPFPPLPPNPFCDPFACFYCFFSWPPCLQRSPPLPPFVEEPISPTCASCGMSTNCLPSIIPDLCPFIISLGAGRVADRHGWNPLDVPLAIPGAWDFESCSQQ